jgi:hypothetical protein
VLALQRSSLYSVFNPVNNYWCVFAEGVYVSLNIEPKGKVHNLRKNRESVHV